MSTLTKLDVQKAETLRSKKQILATPKIEKIPYYVTSQPTEEEVSVGWPYYESIYGYLSKRVFVGLFTIKEENSA